MKKFLKLFLTMCILATIVLLLPIVAKAATVEDLTYSVSGGEVTITGCSQSAEGELVIPSEIDGYPVTSIHREAFYRCRKITSVTIPEGVKEIGVHAFMECTGLVSITIPESVTEISMAAFSHCESLESVTIPSGIMYIRANTFQDCYSLNSVVIPDGVIHIGDSAFMFCESLKTVDIPESVISIGEFAFGYCTGLVSIEIPDNVATIDEYAFSCCTALEDVIIGSGVTSIGTNAFGECPSLISFTVDDNNLYYSSDENGVLFDKEKTTLIKYTPGKADTSYDIPDSVRRIGEAAFDVCTSFENITIPDGVEIIDQAAFRDCTGLTNVKIGKGVTSVGERAFVGCSSLTDITVDNENTTYVSKDGVLFYVVPDRGEILEVYPAGKTDESYVIPENVYYIANRAFQGCLNLKHITIQSGMWWIGEYAFYSCYNLESIEIPDGVIIIDDSAFANCRSVTSVVIPNSVETIRSNTFRGCYELESIVIPPSVTYMNGEIFRDCDFLTIYGETGSHAESYARDYDIPFVAITYVNDTFMTLNFSEDDENWLFNVSVASFNGDAMVYAAVYDESGRVLGVSVGEFVVGGVTQLSLSKTEGAASAGVFVWETGSNRAVTMPEKFEIQ